MSMFEQKPITVRYVSIDPAGGVSIAGTGVAPISRPGSRCFLLRCPKNANGVCASEQGQHGRLACPEQPGKDDAP
jgi:hypothetical protein